MAVLYFQASATRTDSMFLSTNESIRPNNVSAQASIIDVKNEIIPSSVTSAQLNKNATAAAEVPVATNDNTPLPLPANLSTVAAAASSSITPN